MEPGSSLLLPCWLLNTQSAPRHQGNLGMEPGAMASCTLDPTCLTQNILTNTVGKFYVAMTTLTLSMKKACHIVLARFSEWLSCSLWLHLHKSCPTWYQQCQQHLKLKLHLQQRRPLLMWRQHQKTTVMNTLCQWVTHFCVRDKRCYSVP